MLQNRHITIQTGQLDQRLCDRLAPRLGQLSQRTCILAGQRHQQRITLISSQLSIYSQTTEDTLNQTHIGQIQHQACHTDGFEALQRQLLHFQIGFQTCVAINFSAKLQRLARSVRTGWARMQDRAAIAQPSQGDAIEQVGIDSCHLRRGVSANPQGTTAELVHQFESFEIKGMPGSGQQRFKMLEQRRHDQFIAIATRHIQPDTAQFFYTSGLSRQNVSDVLWQQPSRRHRNRVGG